MLYLLLDGPSGKKSAIYRQWQLLWMQGPF